MVTERDIHEAAEILRRGGLVAFPTETVYGLGCDAGNPQALQRLFSVKGRPSDHPVIVHLGAAEMLDDWTACVPAAARTLAAACWPGPLTIVLPRSARVPDEVTGGRDTVAVRVPDQAIALDLLRVFAGGVAAPSANRFGNVSPTTAAHVRDELGDEVDLVLDGGACTVGVESTIVDCSDGEPVILRLGGCPQARVEELVGHLVELHIDGQRAAPGTLARHYAPKAKVVLTSSEEVERCALDAAASGRSVGVLALDPPRSLPDGIVVLASPSDVDDYAHVLYARLREADHLDLDVLLVVPPPAFGVGAAVRDRLRRASARRDA